VRACCGSGCDITAAGSLITFFPNADDTGGTGTAQDGCRSVEVGVSALTNCQNGKLQLAYPNTGGSEFAAVDDLSVVGDMIIGAISTNALTSPGTYTTSVQSCIAHSTTGDITLGCDYGPAGLSASDNIVFP
jgi:hypothetical protein